MSTISEVDNVDVARKKFSAISFEILQFANNVKGESVQHSGFDLFSHDNQRSFNAVKGRYVRQCSPILKAGTIKQF